MIHYWSIGVGAVLSLNEQWELGCCGAPDWAATGVPYMHLPCIDHFNGRHLCPSISFLVLLVECYEFN
jgi:hypothetical protein